MKKVVEVRPRQNQHWVGDGFPVRSAFSMHETGYRLNPFLLMDYAGPADFPPSVHPRGVGEHPHKGFETVTIVYQGELEHADSSGNHGRIGPGDVQWMTAASGVMHQEYHSSDFSRRGGTLEMIQLWVNLPAEFKSREPGYQTLLDRDIPVVELSEIRGRVRVIAGELRGTRGPARTFTPINLWDGRLLAGDRVELIVPTGYTTALFVLRGEVVLNGEEAAREAELAVFDRKGEKIVVETRRDATFLVLNGEPIDEPVVAYGPFVMNKEEEIRQALADAEAGRMGGVSA